MELSRIILPPFSVVGKEGSTHDGDGFIQKLWCALKVNFTEVEHLAKRDKTGALCGIWGLMSGFSRSFEPWGNGFTEGLYLAGVEACDGATPPEGWVKWTVPGYKYLCAKAESPKTFVNVIHYMDESGILLAGAVHEFTRPSDGQEFLYFPIERL